MAREPLARTFGAWRTPITRWSRAINTCHAHREGNERMTARVLSVRQRVLRRGILRDGAIGSEIRSTRRPALVVANGLCRAEFSRGQRGAT